MADDEAGSTHATDEPAPQDWCCAECGAHIVPGGPNVAAELHDRVAPGTLTGTERCPGTFKQVVPVAAAPVPQGTPTDDRLNSNTAGGAWSFYDQPDGFDRTAAHSEHAAEKAERGTEDADHPAARLAREGVQRSYRDALARAMHDRYCGCDDWDKHHDPSEPSWPEMADAAARVPHPDTAEVARLRAELAEAQQKAARYLEGAEYERQRASSEARCADERGDLFREMRTERDMERGTRATAEAERDEARNERDAARVDAIRFAQWPDDWRQQISDCSSSGVAVDLLAAWRGEGEQDA